MVEHQQQHPQKSMDSNSSRISSWYLKIRGILTYTSCINGYGLCKGISPPRKQPKISGTAWAEAALIDAILSVSLMIIFIEQLKWVVNLLKNMDDGINDGMKKKHVQDTLHFRYLKVLVTSRVLPFFFKVYVPARERDILRLHQESVETVRWNAQLCTSSFSKKRLNENLSAHVENG